MRKTEVAGGRTPRQWVRALTPNGRRLLCAALCLVLLLAAVLPFALPAALKRLAPGWYVWQAAGRTLAQMETTRGQAAQAMGWDAAVKAAGEQPTQQQAYLGFAGDGLPEKLGVGLEVRSAPEKRAMDAAANIQVDRVPVFWAHAAVRDAEVAVQLPSILPGSYRADSETLGRDWNASALADYLGRALPEDYGFNLFELLGAAGDGQHSPAGRLWQQAAELAGSARVEWVGAGETTLASGQAAGCERFSLALSGDEATAFLRQAAGTVFGGEALGLLQPVAAGLAELERRLSEVTVEDVTGDVLLYKGRVVELRFATCLARDGEWEKLEGSIQLEGHRSKSMAVLLGLSLDDWSGQFRIELETATAGGLAQAEGRMSLLARRGGQMLLSAQGGFSYHQSEGREDNLSLTAGLKVQGHTVEMEAAGLWLAGQNTTLLELLLDNVEVAADGKKYAFTVEYLLEMLKGESFAEAGGVRLFDLTEAELKRLEEVGNWDYLDGYID